MHIITVANLKGGSAKTTTSVHLAHALAERGLRTFLIDADRQGSTLRWSELAEWHIPTVAMPTTNLHSRLTGVVPRDVDVVIIDTPPLAEDAGIVASALRAADTIIVTTAPSMIEFERLSDVWAALDDIDALRRAPATVGVLLNRTVANASSTETFRELIESGGRHVFLTAIPRREAFAQAFGAGIGPKDLGAYADLADELLPTITKEPR